MSEAETSLRDMVEMTAHCIPGTWWPHTETCHGPGSTASISATSHREDQENCLILSCVSEDRNISLFQVSPNMPWHELGQRARHRDLGLSLYVGATKNVKSGPF